MYATHGRHRVSQSPKRCQGNTVRLVLTGLAALAIFLGLAVPADAGTRPGSVTSPTPRPKTRAAAAADWSQRADVTIDRAIAADTGTGSPFAYSWLASAIAQRHGWDDSRAMHYLQLALDQQHPSGGYGKPDAWDAFGDGTLNAASTDYTVTAYQVGEVVLEAYKAGKVPYTDVTDIMRSVVNTPRIPVSPGIGVAYSNNPNDVKPGYMVHNVNQTTAMLFADAQRAGVLWSQSQISSWISKINQQELATYVPNLYGWPYRTGGSQKVQDADHNALGVAMLLTLDPAKGLPALQYAMSHDLGAPIAHAYLGRYSCSSSVRWFGEYDAAIAGTYSTFSWLSEFARYAALTATACSPGTADLAPHAFR